MGAGREQVLDEIALISACLGFPGGHPDHAATATPLRAKLAFCRSFDVAAVGDRNDASLIGDQVFERDLSLVRQNCCEAFGSVFVPNPEQFLLDDRHYSIRAT